MRLRYFATALFMLLNYLSYSQSINKTKYWIDENGKSLSEALFLEKWSASDAEFARWDYIAKDSGMVAKTAHRKLNLYTINHPFFLKYINRVTNKKLAENTILLIEFKYKDDFCGSNSSNKWEKTRIKNRKKYTDRWKNIVESKNPNLVYLIFYEKEIVLQNSNSDTEYFFSDTEGFLRKNIFLDPTLCGSFLLSKPDGKTIVLNGENTAERMAVNLDPKIWDSLLFN
jgi:hypothetical protein